MRITAPGLYQMDSDLYHADPCPSPSLSSSGAHTLVHDCPAVFAWQRANRTNKRVFDIGTAAHLMVLEPNLFDQSITIIKGETRDGRVSEGYTTQAARDQRDAAYAAGKTPLLQKEVDMILAMRMALHADPVARFAFTNGKPEQSIFWRDDEFGVWCRTRPDWLPNHPRYAINYKTADSVKPEDIERTIYNLGYFQKAAWECDGIEAVTGTRPEKFYLVAQTKKPPHTVATYELDPEDLFYGARLNRKARGIYAWCMEHNEWPGYREDLAGPAKAIRIQMPGWARNRLQKMDEAGELEPPALMEEV
jgi:hypothetical protein